MQMQNKIKNKNGREKGNLLEAATAPIRFSIAAAEAAPAGAYLREKC